MHCPRSTYPGVMGSCVITRAYLCTSEYRCFTAGESQALRAEGDGTGWLYHWSGPGKEKTLYCITVSLKPVNIEAHISQCFPRINS